jgi:hypothetical protein
LVTAGRVRRRAPAATEVGTEDDVGAEDLGEGLEVTDGIEQMLEQLDLTDDERQALEGDSDAITALAEKLADVPTPAGPTPNQIGAVPDDGHHCGAPWPTRSATRSEPPTAPPTARTARVLDGWS